MVASWVFWVLLVKQLGAAQLTTILAAIGDNCKQYPSKMADSYAISYDVMSYLLFYIYAYMGAC